MERRGLELHYWYHLGLEGHKTSKDKTSCLTLMIEEISAFHKKFLKPFMWTLRPHKQNWLRKKNLPNQALGSQFTLQGDIYFKQPPYFLSLKLKTSPEKKEVERYSANNKREGQAESQDTVRVSGPQLKSWKYASISKYVFLFPVI